MACSQPRALATDEIPGVIEQFVRAARNAREAGFDGVEIHGANGYLFEQFLNPHVNRREDAYGGSVANRARLLLETAQAVSAAIGADRVGVRLSPFGGYNDMPAYDETVETYHYLAQELGAQGIVYLHFMDQGNPSFNEAFLRSMRERYRGTIILCSGYTYERADAALKAGLGDLIAFGRPFISNPDLPLRLRQRATLADPNPATFYGGGAEGYTDYPALSAGA